RLDLDDDLFRAETNQLPQPIHEPAAGRCDLDRHPAGRGHGPKAPHLPACGADHTPGRRGPGGTDPAHRERLRTRIPGPTARGLSAWCAVPWMIRTTRPGQ